MTRIYKQSAIYDCRIFNMRNLWEPSTTYMGKAVEKPNYLIGVLMRKTRANWYEEPALAGFAKSCKELYDAALSHIPFQQVDWPVKNGDVDNLGKAVPEWRKGNWLLNGSSTTPIEVSINQGGAVIPLRNNTGTVKPGDYVMVTTSIAVKTNDPRGIKTYINKVVFMGPGEEIAIGSSVSTADLMAEAKAQGLNVTGFGGSGGPQEGFGQGFGPVSVPPAEELPHHPDWGTGTFPSSSLAPPPVAPPAQQGFSTPQGFNVPQGFPPRQ